MKSAGANVYRVPKKAWAKWSRKGRAVFNSVFSAMRGSPWSFQTPGAGKIPARSWRVTAWNAAWVAADAVDGR